MAFLICPQCNQRVANLMVHSCARARKSDGGVESRHAAGVVPEQPVHGIGSEHRVRKEHNRTQAGVAPSPSEPQRKRGRPRIGETRDKPWEVLGISSRTWYRRQAEQRAKQ